MSRLKVLLRDYDYKIEGKLLISKGIKGFTTDRIVKTVKDEYDACEYLCPIIKDKDFTERFMRGVE